MPPSDEASIPPPEHYFTERPHARSDRRELRFLYRGALLSFQVDSGIFASHGLDPGTALLIEALDPEPGHSVLDLGCGWGAVGIAAARCCPSGRIVMTDVNRRAVGLSRGNAVRNRLANVEVRSGSFFRPVESERFDLIATNPPYHVGREEILRFLNEVPDHLRPGGRLLMVGKGSQGILFYQQWLEDHFPGEVRVRARGSGYRVLEARLEPGPPSAEHPSSTPKRPDIDDETRSHRSP